MKELPITRIKSVQPKQVNQQGIAKNTNASKSNPKMNTSAPKRQKSDTEATNVQKRQKRSNVSGVTSPAAANKMVSSKTTSVSSTIRIKTEPSDSDIKTI